MGSTLAIFAIAILSALCIGGVGLALTIKESKTTQRMALMAGPNRSKALRGEGEVDNNEKRRKQVQDTLNTLEQKQNANKKISLQTKLQRAGFETKTRKFHIISAFFGLAVASLFMVFGFSALVALGAPLFFPRFWPC